MYPTPFTALVNQLLDLLKYYLQSFINFGDKRMDNMIITIVGTFITIIATMFPKLWYIFLPINGKVNYYNHQFVAEYVKKDFDTANCFLLLKPEDSLFSSVLYYVYTCCGFAFSACGITMERTDNELVLRKSGMSISKNYAISLLQMNRFIVFYNFFGVVEVVIRPESINIHYLYDKHLSRFMENVLRENRPKKNNTPVGGLVIAYSYRQDKVPIHSDRSMDTWVSKYKPLILNCIERMNSSSYMGGMGNKNLGVLLYGPPGTGKTSFIRALANYTNRNILMIDLRKIYTTTDFLTLTRTYDHTSFIYVLEEADFIFASVGNANNVSKTELEKRKMELMKNVRAKEGADIVSKELEFIRGEILKLQDNFTIDWFLNYLDGIEDYRGRVLIVTTNNPDKIYPALIRPGRIDVQLRLDKFTESEVIELLERIYMNDPKKEAIRRFKYPDGKYTPAEIINLASTKNDIDKVISSLKIEQ